MAGLARREIASLVAELREPPYRAGQLFSWVQRKGAAGYDAMSDVPRGLRERLAARHPARRTTVADERRSEDGTVKLLLRMPDGEAVECVLIPEEER
ncbi:MAG: bifunctional tRNA (adenosine(37)-C2)-methyltransferase TrmG/ribosomal RNA large subunit methyltransferase RlmN, partial [Planctomycetota bacterium]